MGSKPAENRKTVNVVSKEFMRGSALDENTLKNSVLFFGSLLIVFFMGFIVSLTTSAAGGILRISVNVAVINLTPSKSDLTVFKTLLFKLSHSRTAEEHSPYSRFLFKLCFGLCLHFDCFCTIAKCFENTIFNCITKHFAV